ncbi:mps one binder kinase activator-like 4-like protein [Jimgerdemannia flammicorona]|uniref:Mps one binder kinase activator-like 4-like protein n=1 Tax=Jimgerdemannia flammicorona TaxID=994334 RepID=A0A433DJ56_9FUNG|nr:mps one binder kinase activator-like 4-like protein [Jimgerdemannia flammicorona]
MMLPNFQNSYQWPFISLDQLDSSFSLQEYLQALIRKDRENVGALVALPPGQDDEVWQYEHLRQLCLELNHFVVQLETECNRETCPEMKAEEWLYLCAAHQAPQSVCMICPAQRYTYHSNMAKLVSCQCCAIDYIVHTLDGASTLLNSNRFFPSRISIPEPSLKHYQSIARRLYRIFAHAWFHHREVFESYENESFLYARFLHLSRQYKLVSQQLIIIPDGKLSSTTSRKVSAVSPVMVASPITETAPVSLANDTRASE